MNEKFIIRLFIFSILTSIFAFSGCGNSKKKNIDDNQSSSETVSKNLKGFIQKGPFIQGSEIKVQELDSSLVPKGTTFLTETENDFGGFTLDKGFSSPFLEVTASGFYFDEVRGKLSEAGIRFKVLSKPSENKPVNINILTTLERERIKHLINEQNKSFEEARVQAEREILDIFHIPDQINSNFQEMDIARKGEANAVLLAISAILQGTKSVAELSEMISKISQDIKTDGTLDNGTFINTITESNRNLNLPQIRDNLFKRYESLGLTIDVPKFEDYVDSDGDTVINKYDFTINLTPVENAELKTDYTSEEVTIVLPPSVQTAEATVDNGTVVVNGTEADDHATVKAGDKVSVKLTASLDYNSEVSSTLYVAYPENQLNAGIFSVTTRGDEYFTLADETVTDADLNIEYTSKEQLIVLPESIKNATAAIDNGTLVVNGTESGTSAEVKNGDKIAIAITSSSNLNETVKSELTVSYEGNHNISCEFSVTTRVQGYIGLENEILQLVEADKFYTTKEREVNFPANISEATIKIEKGVIVVNGEEKGKETKLVTGDKFQIKLHSGDEYHYLKPAKTEISISYLNTEEKAIFLLNRKEAFKRFCAGSSHACYINRSNSLYCWGNNERGQLGIGERIFETQPEVVGEPGTWETVSCRDSRTCGITKNGNLYCWGHADDQTGSYKDKPMQIGEKHAWKDVTAQDNYVCGIKKDSSIWCLRDFATESSSGSGQFIPVEPKRIGKDNDWYILTNSRIKCSFKNSHSFLCWGNIPIDENDFTNVSFETDLPQEVLKTYRIENTFGHISLLTRRGNIHYSQHDVTTGRTAAIGISIYKISFDGKLHAKGSNFTGGIANGKVEEKHYEEFQSIMEDKRFFSIFSNAEHACAVTESEDIYCWGLNNAGQIDATDMENNRYITEPKLIISGSKLFFKEVQNADLNKTYTSNEEWITGSGTVSIDNGTLIINGEEQGQSAEVKENDKISIKLTSSDEHGETISSKVTLKTENGETLETTFSITTRVEPYFTIKNEVIHRAMPETDYTSTPVTVTLPDSIPTAHISIDGGVILVNDQESGKDADVKNGDIVAIKLNTGDTTAYYRHKISEITVSYVDAVIKSRFYLYNESAYGKLSSQSHHTCAIDTAGALYCWGQNSSGSLGIGPGNYSLSPVKIGSDNDWEKVTAGGSHTCAIKTNGALYCWGQNNFGQLGDGSNKDRYHPVKVGTDSDWKYVASGGNNTCALKKDGSLYCWGINTLLDFQEGETPENNTPLRVGDESDWSYIIGGGKHYCAAKTDGSLYCWQSDQEMGIYTHTEPTLVDSEKKWKSIEPATYHICAIDDSDKLFCRGKNLYGALGTGTNASSDIYSAVDSQATPIYLSMGNHYTSAMIDINNKLFHWGNTKFLYMESGNKQNTPIPFDIEQSVSSVTIAQYHGCFISTEGEIYCWGKNNAGQLGNGTGKDTLIPVLAISMKNLKLKNVENTDVVVE